MDVNPYAPVTDEALNPYTNMGDDAKAASIRRKHISHEASVKSFGALYVLVGVMSILWGAFMFNTGLVGLAPTSSQNFSESIFSVVLGVLVVTLGMALAYSGLCMRNLKQSGKVLAIVMAAIGLLAVPLGTLISMYSLWLLLSEKGNVIFSPEYRRVIDATPHIKYKTSIIVWIFVVPLIVLVLFGIFEFVEFALRHG